mmetsp:Transcript_34863/g.42049  ORF Transcript_34863/g.42049 Transcript_34863/m.42049 type:complete len:99 (-) Transcript_34863:184-480(-)|eukprot:CAMPEP_0197846734 /NCGR_PEP_ID=MMETSP1438-20131217/4245_1 /TAXON_ID=1461541 /ORGANISM="Pterosperma sp., Strain CCMP1384" /LENGTH=98 /DNA_ID=CAMNT_0043458483 /DNA_START=92 /DNA_END=388 /DNA_ORIENTATION=+
MNAMIVPLALALLAAPLASADSIHDLSPPPFGTYLDEREVRLEGGLDADGVAGFVMLSVVGGFFFFLLFLYVRKLSVYIGELQDEVYNLKKRVEGLEV